MSEPIIRLATQLILSMAAFAVVFSVINLILWSWLAAWLTCVAVYFAQTSEIGQKVQQRAGDLAVTGCAHIYNLFRPMKKEAE